MSTVKLDFHPSLDIHPVVSVSLVKPFKPRTDEPPPVQIRGEDSYEVDKIINFNIAKRTSKQIAPVVTFCVKWKGAYENSWHQMADLTDCIDLVQQFLFALTPAARKKVVRNLPAQYLDKFSQQIRDLAP